MDPVSFAHRSFVSLESGYCTYLQLGWVPDVKAKAKAIRVVGVMSDDTRNTPCKHGNHAAACMGVVLVGTVGLQVTSRRRANHDNDISGPTGARSRKFRNT